MSNATKKRRLMSSVAVAHSDVGHKLMGVEEEKEGEGIFA
jgi:hypothetical protein